MIERPTDKQSDLVTPDKYRHERVQRLPRGQIYAGQLCTARLIEYADDPDSPDYIARDYLVEITRVPNRVQRTLSRLMPRLAKVSFSHLFSPETSGQPTQETHHLHPKGELFYDPSQLIVGLAAMAGLVETPREQGYLLSATHGLEGTLCGHAQRVTADADTGIASPLL